MINRTRRTAIELALSEEGFTVRLDDGGELSVRWDWVPKLWAATPSQRNAARVSESGTGLHWDQIDEDLSVDGLVRDAERRHLEERLKSVQIAVKVDIDKL